MLHSHFWKQFFEETGDIAHFTGRLFSQWFKPRYEINEFLQQCFIIGYKSLPLVMRTAFIMGLVLTPATMNPGTALCRPEDVSLLYAQRRQV